MAFKLISSSFDAGDPIPEANARDGKDASPALSWEGVPPGTQSLVLICQDPDAPRPEPWVHWLLYEIPPSVTKLPEGIPARERLQLPPGALQGRNSWNEIGYGGPQPPPGHGWHRYYFKLFALDKRLDLPPGVGKSELEHAMEGHLLGETSVMGRFQRERAREAG
jgi:Raf kinase inhibitor-like YbhB/YbcL family protein